MLTLERSIQPNYSLSVLFVMGKTFKIEGGQGGKKGHSNMTHWTGTEEIKERSKSLRRQEDKKVVRILDETDESLDELAGGVS